METIDLAAQRPWPWARGLVGTLVVNRLQIPVKDYCRKAARNGMTLHSTNLCKARDYREVDLGMSAAEIEWEAWNELIRVVGLVYGKDDVETQALLSAMFACVGITITEPAGAR